MRSLCPHRPSSEDLRKRFSMSLKKIRRPNCAQSQSRPRKETMWLLHQEEKPAKWLFSKGWTRFRMERGLTSKPRTRPPTAPAAGAAAVVVDVAGAAGAVVKGTANEYFA